MKQGNELSRGAGAKVLRSARISFHKAYAFCVLGFYAYIAVLVSITLIYVEVLPADWPEKLLLLAFVIPVIALLVAPLLVFGRNVDRWLRWEYGMSGVRVYWREALRADLKWFQIQRISYRKKRVILKLDRWWEAIGMSGLTKEEYLELKQMWEKNR